MTKYVEAEKLIEWVNDYYSDDDRICKDDFECEIKDISIEFDADGWCWDMEKAPRGVDILQYRPLAKESNDPEIAIRKMVSCDKKSPQGVIHNSDGWCHPTAWRPLPAIPKKDD